MANDDIVQVISDAREDAVSLSQFMYYPATVTVNRRLAPPIHTLNYYLQYLEGLEKIYSQPTGTVTVNGEEVKTVRQAINDSVDSVLIGEYQTQLEGRVEANELGIVTLDASIVRIDDSISELPVVEGKVPASKVSVELGVSQEDKNLEVQGTLDSQQIELNAQKLDTGITATAQVQGAVEESLFSKLTQFINLKTWGAKGDGVTDDTAAIQACFNYIETLDSNMKKSLYIPQGVYKFTSLTLDQSNLVIYTSGIFSTMFSCTDTTDTPAIHFKGALIQLIEFNLDGDRTSDYTTGGKIALLFDRGVGKAQDVDCEMVDCRINHFYYGAKFIGRGFKNQGCLWANCEYAVDLHWRLFSEFAPPSRPDDPTKQYETGFRHFEFVGCRFHSIGRAAIRNDGTHAMQINNVNVIGCTLDMGKILWYGKLCNALIDSNTIQQSPYEGFYLTGGKNWTISNTVVMGENDVATPTKRIPANFMYIAGDHVNTVISNMFFRDCTEHGISIRSSTNGCKSMTIRDIHFVNPCISGGDFVPISIVGDTHQIDIKNVTHSSSRTLTAVVKNTGASAVTVDNIVSIGNSTKAIKGATVIDKKSWHYNDSLDRHDFIGSGSPEGVVTATPASTYRNITGGAGTTFYIKETTSGNTGWVAK